MRANVGRVVSYGYRSQVGLGCSVRESLLSWIDLDQPFIDSSAESRPAYEKLLHDRELDRCGITFWRGRLSEPHLWEPLPHVWRLPRFYDCFMVGPFISSLISICRRSNIDLRWRMILISVA